MNIMRLIRYHYPVDDQLLAKWKSAINNKIPLFLSDNGLFEDHEHVYFYISTLNREVDLTLKLPIYPKTIKELKTICFWLEKMFRCSFNNAKFNKIIFNPEIIKLLFGNENIKFHVVTFDKLYFFKSFYKSQIEFLFDHLTITYKLELNMRRITNIEEKHNFLLKLLFYSGIPYVNIDGFDDLTKLYDLIINHIKTSKDCSKMVQNIKFSKANYPHLKIEIKPDRIVTRGIYEKTGFSEYENVHNSKIKFLAKFSYKHDKHYVFTEMISNIKIERIKRTTRYGAFY